MSVEEKNEEAGVDARAGEQEPEGATQSSAPHAGGGTFRIGTKDDIRASGGEAGGGKPKPRDAVRDGTK